MSCVKFCVNGIKHLCFFIRDFLSSFRAVDKEFPTLKVDMYFILRPIGMEFVGVKYLATHELSFRIVCAYT